MNYGLNTALFSKIRFDGGVMTDKKTGIGEKVSAMLRKYQPEAILFQGPLPKKNLIRRVGNERGTAPYPNWSRSDAVTSSDGTVKIPDLRGNPDGNTGSPGKPISQTGKESGCGNPT